MIKFRCTNCGKKIGMPLNTAGKRVRCNVCRTVQHVPMDTPADVDEQKPSALDSTQSADDTDHGAAH